MEPAQEFETRTNEPPTAGADGGVPDVSGPSLSEHAQSEHGRSEDSQSADSRSALACSVRSHSVSLGWCLAALLLLTVYIGKRAFRDRPDNVARPVMRYQVDLNRARLPELEALPEIGPEMAKRIVQFRQTHGDFATLDALLDVYGMGPKTLERIRPMLYVSGRNAVSGKFETESNLPSVASRDTR